MTFPFRVISALLERLQPEISLKLLISTRTQLTSSSNPQMMMAVHQSMNMSLNNAILRAVCGVQSKRFQLIKKTMPRLRRKSARRRRSRLKSMDLRKETLFSSVFVLRTRAVLERQVTQLTCTRFVPRR